LDNVVDDRPKLATAQTVRSTKPSLWFEQNYRQMIENNLLQKRSTDFAFFLQLLQFVNFKCGGSRSYSSRTELASIICKKSFES